MVGKLIPLLLGILISQEMATHTQSRVHSLPTGLLPPPPHPQKRVSMMKALRTGSGLALWIQYTGSEMTKHRRKQMSEMHQLRQCVYTVTLSSNVNRGQPGKSQNEGAIV